MRIKLLRLWTGPLPKEELFPRQGINNPLKHWLLHPLKRHSARAYLKLLQKMCGLKVIAIGGSNGKSTTRTILLQLLSSKYSTVATYDSVTSTYNIPTSILKCRPWTKYFICEMSVEYPGDMDFYLWLAKPDITITTMIDIEHTQFLTSLESVTKEELKITRGNWIKVVNGSDAHIPYQNISRCYTFGYSPKFDCYIKSVNLTKNITTECVVVINNTEHKITLPFAGKHYAQALAASLLTISKLTIDFIPLLPNLQALKLAPHRFTVTVNTTGTHIIDDTYNSNPSSLQASINTAAELAQLLNKKLIIVTSQMNELGPLEIQEHQRMGELLKKITPQYVFSIGPAAHKIGQHCESKDQLQQALSKVIHKNAVVLFKGSRSWKLETLVEHFS